MTYGITRRIPWKPVAVAILLAESIVACGVSQAAADSGPSWAKNQDALQPGAPNAGPVAERIKSIRDRVAQGIDPLYVGELVREGIENDWPYIFTDNEFEPFVEARFAAIKEGFNRIRGRIPRR